MTAQKAVAAVSASSRLFWRFWLAKTVSDVGTAMTTVALPLLAITVLEATVFQVALLAAAGNVAWLILGLPAGVIVQRFPLRGLQVSLDLVRLVAIGSIPAAWWLGSLTYPHLVVVALVISFATVLFDIGNSTFLPAIIDKKELTARNSVISGTGAVTKTAGPSASGLLINLLGPVVVLVIDAVSYLVSAVTLRTLPERRPPQHTEGRLTQLIREGWRFVTRHAVMRPCMLWATAVNFVNAGLVALTPLYLIREAEVSAAIVGIVLGLDGAGSLIGAAAATRLSARLGTARAMLVASAVGGVFALAIPLTTGLANVWCYGLGLVGFSFGVVVGSIATRTHRQTDSPPELLSRVMATVRFVSWGAIPLGAGFAGLLGTVLGLRPALWVVCAGALVAPLILFTSAVRHRRNLSDMPED